MKTNPTKLPQSFESERMVLSAILGDTARFYEIASIVSERDFSTDFLGWAFGKIGELCERNQRPSMFNIQQGYGSNPNFETFRQALVGLTECVPAQAVEYARTMADRSALRRMALAVSNLSSRVDTATCSEDARKHIECAFMDACGISVESKGFRPVSAIVADIEERMANPKLVEKFKTGWPTLDKMTKGGLRGKQFVVIGGRTGGGKTVAAMNLAVSIAMQGFPVAAFSLEMDDVDLITRCILAESHRGPDGALDTIRKLPLYVDDTSNVTLKSIAARIKMMITRYNVKVFIVDYLQLIGTDGQERDSRERIVAGMSRLLKVTAKETNTCIISLSQLNEAMELRESRAIEQDADVVLYVVEDKDGDVHLRVVKQRGGASHGPIKQLDKGEVGIPLNWDKENFRFTERR